MDDVFKSLDIDKGEWLEDIERGNSSLLSCLACVEECFSEIKSRRFEEGLNTKVKLDIYKRFCKSVEFKKYLHGVCDVGSRLMFKFRLGMNGLNEELGRHRGREGKMECSLYGDECDMCYGSVQHIVVQWSRKQLWIGGAQVSQNNINPVNNNAINKDKHTNVNNVSNLLRSIRRILKLQNPEKKNSFFLHVVPLRVHSHIYGQIIGGARPPVALLGGGGSGLPPRFLLH